MFSTCYYNVNNSRNRISLYFELWDRFTLLHEAGNIFPVFYQLQEQQQFVALLNNENTIKLVGNYLHRTLECRRFLLKMHKNND